MEKLYENNVAGAEALLGITASKRRYHFMLLSGRIISITGGTILLFFLITEIGETNGLNLWSIGCITFFLALALFILTDGVLSKIISVGDYETTVPRFTSFLTFFNYLLFFYLGYLLFQGNL